MDGRVSTMLLLALSSLPGGALAADCPDPAELQKEAIEVLRREFPGESALPGTNGSVVAGRLTFDLGSLRKRLCLMPRSSPADRAPIIREHFRAGLQAGTDLQGGVGHDWAAARDQVVIQLVDEDRAVRARALRRRVVPGVAAVVVLDLPTTYLYVGPEAIARWGIDEAALFDRAVLNLERKTRGEMQASGEGADLVIFVGERDGFDAARLLTPRLRKAAAKLLGDPFRAAIPNRDFLVLWARGNTRFATQAAGNARRDFESRPYPVSPSVLEVWVDGRIDVVPSPRR